MNNDPRSPGDEEDKRTRLVSRPDMQEGAVPPRTGSVIGTTRLVGNFGASAASPAARPQPLAKTQYIREGTVDIDPVAGWIVIVKGPGRGGFRPVFVGMNSVGRGPDQRISLDFGDESISREEHAFITFDDETQTFYLQHGGKSNLVRLGGKPVLAPTELKPNDIFRIGNTTFRFVACCGPDFSWNDEVGDA
ncbi:FHA domain-containing protein [Hyphomicrobium sp.]|uniref:FHA domain-containing protein n=1 Tax=Hyphomicrobium sp. TaxID=82 RepID=UPI002E334EB3|nr:FHA domain-containing protein [Hyphomicrobium sp.]HEX2839719.1 FHA domain-containing protein [Hyphomicrobium sp.]